MLLELHAHTVKYSKCSQCDPIELVRRVQEKKLQGLVITEHHYLWSDDEIKQLRVAAGAQDCFLIFAAQEVDTDFGHILVYGAPATIEKRVTLKELRAQLPQAALVWAHPFRNGVIPQKEKLLDPLIDAIEIFSSNHTLAENCLALRFWHEHKFNAIAASDCHEISLAAAFPTQLIHPIKTIEELVCELKAGRCLPFFKEIPKAGSSIVVNEVVFGTKGEDESRSRIIIKKITEKKRFESEEKIYQVVEDLRAKYFADKTFRIPRLISIDSLEREIVEEGQRGKTLAELLPRVNTKIGRSYLALAARWLARLHKVKADNSDIDASLAREAKRFKAYAKQFQFVPQLYDKYFQKLIEFIQIKETEIFTQRKREFVYNHGDYHPKNIIIGQDHAHDASTVFISVIDFNNMIAMPPAFDVGYFLVQFESQLYDLRKKHPQKYFINAYIKEAGKVSDTFLADVEFFKLRANLSIAAYLVKVGVGDSAQMRRIIKTANY